MLYKQNNFMINQSCLNILQILRLVSISTLITIKMEYSGKIQIMITDPVLISTSGSSYVSYKILGVDQKGEFQKKRRYRDFFMLRQKLVSRWPGLYIPPISSKKATGNTQERFVCFRKKFLDYFCQKVAERDHLYYSQPFQAFIRGQSQFEASIKQLPVIQYENLLTIYQKNFTELTQNISAAELQISTQADYNFLKSSEKSLEKLRDNYKRVLDAKTQYDNQFQTVFGKALKEYEDKFLINYVEGDKSKLFLNSNQDFSEKLTEYREYTKNNIFEEYIEKISYQLRQMRALKQAIETRKATQQSRNKFQSKKKQGLEELQKLKEGKTTFKSFFSTGPKDEQIKKLEVNIEKWQKMQQVLTNLIFLMNASIYTELQNYKKNRAQEYKNQVKEMNKKQIKEMSVYGDVLGVLLSDQGKSQQKNKQKYVEHQQNDKKQHNHNDQSKSKQESQLSEGDKQMEQGSDQSD